MSSNIFQAYLQITAKFLKNKILTKPNDFGGSSMLQYTVTSVRKRCTLLPGFAGLSKPMKMLHFGALQGAKQTYSED